MPDKLKRAPTKQAQHPPHRHFTSGSMLSRPLRLARGVELAAALTLSLSTPALAGDSVKINDLVVALSIPDARNARRP